MLGLRFSRLVHASLAGGSLALAGCVDRAYDFGDAGTGGPDPTEGDTETGPDPTNGTVDPTTPTTEPPPPPDVPGPPQLIAVGFADNLTLALTFSEAMAPPTAVDPRQFRLSAAIAPMDEQYYGYGTYYSEVGRWNGVDYHCDEYCYEGMCHQRCWEYCYTPPGPPVRVAAITQPADRPDILLLTFDNGIGPGVCAHLQQYPDPWIHDLFIHYTTQGAAPLTDTVGEPLASIAEHWVLQPDVQYAYVEGTLPFMQPQLPIPCIF